MALDLTKVNLKETNPYFWRKLIDGCKYNESEVLATLDDIATVNTEVETFVDNVWETTLKWEDGEYMGRLGEYESDNHREIAIALSDCGKIAASESYGGHYALPVRRWQNSVKALRRHMKKVQRMINKL